MNEPRVEVKNVNRSYRFEFGCFADQKCNHWYPNPGVYDISADLTIEDSGAPVVQDTSGGLAGAGGVVTRDNDDVTISATDIDGLGVLGLVAYVDGKAVGQTGWSQNKPECKDQDAGDGYRYLAGQPCLTTPPPTTWELPDAPDGRHAVEVRVLDAAGNESRAVSQTVVLDRKAPIFPSAPNVAGEAAVGKRLTCSAADVDGQDPSLGYQWIRTLPDGSGAAAIPGASGAQYDVTAADAGHKLVCDVTATDRGGAASRRSDATAGPFAGGQVVTGSGSGAAAGSGTTPGSGAANGAGATTGAGGTVVLGTAAASTAGPSGPGSIQGPATPIAAGCPVGTLVTLEGSSRLVAKRAGSSTTIAGAVRSGTGAPAAGVAVDLVQRVRRSGVAPITVASGTSGADGRFALKAPVGASRDLQVVTSSCGASGPVVGQSVRGQLKLRAVNPRLRNGQTVRFSGQAVGGYYGKGVGLELQVLVGRKWQDVRAVRTDAKGRFTTSYRFKRTYVRYTYRFRVITRATAGWPFTATRSPIAKVRVN